jgi:hypothetical protein
MKKLSDAALAWFEDWFTSGPGVWQTFGATIAVVLVEFFFPKLDPSGFLLLYWLTVYSAITQPALAYSGARSSRQMEQMLQKIAALEAAQSATVSEDYQVDARTLELVKKLADKMGVE